jgi:hypothetical protein
VKVSTTVSRMWRAVVAMAGPPPCNRLVAANTVGVLGDALFTVSLAGSLFFNVSVDAARPSILLYLLLTLAPFAIVGPFVGTLIDRFPGSQRALIAATNVGRGLAMLLIAWQLSSLVFFPLTFLVLVLSKTSSVAKSSLVPWLVADDSKLVAENARLSRITAMAGGAAGAVGALLLRSFNPETVIVLAACIHFIAAPVALRVPNVRVRRTDPVVDDVELRSGELTSAANAMSAMRACIGFLAFLLAFDLKVSGVDTWFFGFVIAAAGAGGFVGTYLAAFARRHLHEETLITASLTMCGGVALVTAVQYAAPGALLMSFVAGVAANVTRQAFDSLTQRLAPDAEKGRAFARFETRFQIAWVLGALLPVLLRPTAAIGLAALGVTLCLAGLAYLSGLRALRRHQLVVQTALDRREQDLSRSLLAMASALHAQQAERLAITTAVEAVRVSNALGGGMLNGDAMTPELTELWRLAVGGSGPLPDGVTERALVLARAVVDARYGHEPSRDGER